MKTGNWRILEVKGLQSRKVSNFHKIYVKTILVDIEVESDFSKLKERKSMKIWNSNATKVEFLLLESKKVNFM